MVILCLGALLAGLIAAALMPFLAFACALMTAIVIGSVLTLVHGISLAQTALSALALLSAGQIGYGLGLLSVAMMGHVLTSGRGSLSAKRSPDAAPPLRTGNEPL